MKKEDMEKQAAQFVAESRRNVVSLEEAIAPELAGARIFDPPVWGYGDAKDPMFQELKKKEAVGPQLSYSGTGAVRFVAARPDRGPAVCNGIL